MYTELKRVFGFFSRIGYRRYLYDKQGMHQYGPATFVEYNHMHRYGVGEVVVEVLDMHITWKVFFSATNPISLIAILLSKSSHSPNVWFGCIFVVVACFCNFFFFYRHLTLLKMFEAINRRTNMLKHMEAVRDDKLRGEGVVVSQR